MPVSRLDRFRTVLRKPENTTADLGAALNDIKRAEAEAVAAVERQAATVAANFLDPDSKRERDRVELEHLRLAAGDAAAIRGELEKRHAGALAAEQQAGRRAIYDAAKAKGDKAALDLARAYPRLCQGIVGVLRDLAEAQIAVAAANAALPEGVPPLPDPETAARATPGQPREVVSEEVVELWSRMDMQTPVDAEFQDTIYGLDKNGEPSGWGRRPNDLDACYRLRRFRKVTFRDYTNGDYPVSLAAGIRLPAPRGSGMAWGNAHLMHDPVTAAATMGEGEPGNVLARIGELEAAVTARPVKAERPLKTEFELIGDVVPLPVAKPVPDTTHRPIAREQNVRFGSSPFSLPTRASGRG